MSGWNTALATAFLARGDGVFLAAIFAVFAAAFALGAWHPREEPWKRRVRRHTYYRYRP